MKYYLKDKNGTVHTESQNSFKMAFKHHHKKDDTTADGYYTHVYITGFHFYFCYILYIHKPYN